MNQPLVIVTDLGRFRAFRLERTAAQRQRLVLVEEQSFAEAHLRMVDQVSDLAGRHGAPGPRPGAAPMNDDQNFQWENRRRLLARLAQAIDRLVKNAPEAPVWLAAPGEMNPPLLEALAPASRQRVERNEPSDLTKIPKEELLEHFSAVPR